MPFAMAIVLLRLFFLLDAKCVESLTIALRARLRQQPDLDISVITPVAGTRGSGLTEY